MESSGERLIEELLKLFCWCWSLWRVWLIGCLQNTEITLIDRMTLATGKKQCDEELGFTGVN